MMNVPTIFFGFFVFSCPGEGFTVVSRMMRRTVFVRSEYYNPYR